MSLKTQVHRIAVLPSHVRGPAALRLQTALRDPVMRLALFRLTHEDPTVRTQAVALVETHAAQEQSPFISPDVEQRVTTQLDAFLDGHPRHVAADMSAFGFSVPAIFADYEPQHSAATLSQFRLLQRDDPRCAELVLESFQQYGEAVARNLMANPPGQRDNDFEADIFYSGVIKSFARQVKIDLAKLGLPMRRLIREGEHFFPIRQWLLPLHGKREWLAAHATRLHIYRTRYHLPISDLVANAVLEAIPREETKTLFPTRPAWFHELVLHFSDTRDGDPDHYGALLKSARLLQGVSLSEANAAGFGRDVRRLERGRKATHESLRRAAILYNISYRHLLYAYHRTVYPKLFDAVHMLPHYAGPFYFAHQQTQALSEYLDAPGTLGEMVTMALGALDLTGTDTDVLGIDKDLRVDMTTNQQARTRTDRTPTETSAGPPFIHGSGLDRIQQLTLLPDNMLQVLSLWTHFPALRHPTRGYPHLIVERLEREPIMITGDHREDIAKLQRYAEQPHSFGEAIYFARHARGLTIIALSKAIRRYSERLAAFEFNLRPPSPQELIALANALEVTVDALAQRAADTTFQHRSPMTERIISHRTGEIHFQQLQGKHPRADLFRDFVHDLKIAPPSLARRLNDHFATDFPTALRVRHTQLPSWREGPFAKRVVYLSGQSCRLRARAYIDYGEVTLGEILWRMRRDFPNLWSVTEAARQLKLNSAILVKLEQNDPDTLALYLRRIDQWARRSPRDTPWRRFLDTFHVEERYHFGPEDFDRLARDTASLVGQKVPPTLEVGGT
jgi:transcriptional regulator with XRE-family HTH domain